MESIQISNGIKRIAINGDADRVIAFNPNDVQFAERFYTLIHDFETKQGDYQRRAEQLDKVTAVDDNGLPINLSQRIAFMREVCEYMHAQIDLLFGAGTAIKVFEGALDLDTIGQFFSGITPFVERARSEKLAKYAPAKTGKGRTLK
jgi:hypothetical protein